MHQQDDTTQDAVTVPLTAVTQNVILGLGSGLDWKFLNACDTADVRCQIKVSNRTATVKPSPRLL